MWGIPDYFWRLIWYDVSEPRKVPQIPRYDIGLYHSWSSEDHYVGLYQQNTWYPLIRKIQRVAGGTKSRAKVDKYCKKINTKQAVDFHSLVAKTLFSTKQYRPETCIIISFLAMRVRESDYDDCAKLVHIMKYTRGTSNLPLILSANGSVILKFCIDV